MNIIDWQQQTAAWFKNLQEQICANLEKIEQEFGNNQKFVIKDWQYKQQGGGQMRLLRGKVFEKGGVNFSQVSGKFSPEFAKKIPNTDSEGNFWASGISLVIHPFSPMIPTIHMNNRFICTEKSWFGGGVDLTPMISDDKSAKLFHVELQKVCDPHDKNYYPKFKKWCDEYFFLPHRNEMRGVGGIFFDYHNTDNFEADFAFVKSIGQFFDDFYPNLVRKLINKPWNTTDKEKQLLKRGRYVEFNLLYDRGTQFGLQIGGNTEAILMSLPPEAKW